MTQRAKGFPTLNVYKDGVMVNYDYHEVMNAQGFYDCAMAYHIGGKRKRNPEDSHTFNHFQSPSDLDDWIALQRELKATRRAAAKAHKEAVAAGNTTAVDPNAHH
jgi:hypothetical protein